MNISAKLDVVLRLYTDRNFDTSCSNFVALLHQLFFDVHYATRPFGTFVRGSGVKNEEHREIVKAIIIWSQLRTFSPEFAKDHWVKLVHMDLGKFGKMFRLKMRANTPSVTLFPYFLKQYRESSQWACNAMMVILVWQLRAQANGDTALPTEILELIVQFCDYVPNARRSETPAKPQRTLHAALLKKCLQSPPRLSNV